MFTSLVENGESASGEAAGYECHCSMCAGAPLPQLHGAAASDQAPIWHFSNTSTAHLGGNPATLLAGTQWTGRDLDGRVVITYSFSHAGSRHGTEEAKFSATLAEFSTEDRAMVRAVLASIEAVCMVRFVEVADTGNQFGQIRYAYSQAPTAMGYAGFAFYPSAGEVGGNVWIATAQSTAQWAFYRPNLLLHETLHAIGLKHPFESGATLPAELNIIPNTVMSYSPIAGARSGWLSKYPDQPMPLDIVALQALYGAAAYNADDTVYDLSRAEYRSAFRVLWDSGGRDTLDASRAGGAVSLDLRAGTRSEIGGEVRASGYLGSSTVATGAIYTATLAIAGGTTIENAIGSAFGDILLGNEADNVLWGEGGDDIFDGMDGNDRLFGGAGNDLFFVTGRGIKLIDGGSGTDRVVFAGSRSDYSVAEAPGWLVVSRIGDPGTVATLYGIERIEFSDGALTLAMPQSAPVPLLDGLQGQAFRLYNAAFDRLPDPEGLS